MGFKTEFFGILQDCDPVVAACLFLLLDPKGNEARTAENIESRNRNVIELEFILVVPVVVTAPCEERVQPLRLPLAVSADCPGLKIKGSRSTREIERGDRSP